MSPGPTKSYFLERGESNESPWCFLQDGKEVALMVLDDGE